MSMSMSRGKRRAHAALAAAAAGAVVLPLLAVASAQATPTLAGAGWTARPPIGAGSQGPHPPRAYPLRVEDSTVYAEAKAEAARAYGRWRQRHGGAAQANSSSAPRTIVSGGLNKPGMDAGVGGRQFTPPDTTGAIGPSHYVEFVNSEISVYNRSTLATPPLAELDESTFVGDPLALTCDAQIQWDEQGQRWLYAALNCNATAGNQALYFGWSKTPTPTNLFTGWCRYRITTGHSLEDYPKLGHDNSQLVIGTNAFSSDGNGSYTDSHIWIVDKSAPGVATCPAQSALDATRKELTGIQFTPVPADIADSSPSGYVVADDPFGDPSHLTLYRVGRNGAGQSALLETDTVSIPAYDIPANVPQPGTAEVIDSSDGRLTQAVAVKDPATGTEGIWTQHTVAPVGGGPSVVRWYELTPSATAPRQTGAVGGPGGTFAFNGAISPTSDGTSAAVFYNSGDGSHLVDLRAMDRRAGTPLGHTVEDLHLGTSIAADEDFSCADPLPCRWGDYAGATPDPANPSLVWGTGELTTLAADGLGSSQWGSRNVAIDTSTLPAASVSSATPVGTTTATLHGAVNPEGGATAYHFEYGTTTAYGRATPSASAGAGKRAVAVSASISALTPGTTYHFRLVASNALGMTNTPDATFATTALPPKLCIVPKVKGKKLRKAKTAIRKAHCSVGKVKRAFSKKFKKGRVIAEKPRAGAKRAQGAKVRLTVSKGKPRRHR